MKPRKWKDYQMTTHAQNRIKSWKKKNILRLATWNIRALNNKDQELIEELKHSNIEICALQETKKKGRGQYQYEDYTLIYSGVQKSKRATAGVGILIHNKYKNSLDGCEYVSERILSIKLKTEGATLHIISAYSPEECKPKDEREAFFKELQRTLDNIPSNEAVIVAGDFNARTGNEIIPGIKQRFNENCLNDNGELLIDLCTFNNLRINNTFFNLPEQYKYTFQNTRGHKSIIDYILTNRNIHPQQIMGVRTLNSADVGSDHSLLLCKIRFNIKKATPNKVDQETKWNIESLWNDATKKLYQDRLTRELEKNEIATEDEPEVRWEKIKNSIKEAANQALGTRTVKRNNRPNKTPWFKREVKEKCQEKRIAYLRYKNLRTQESHEEYKKTRNKTKTLIRRIKREHWVTFSKRMESDFYGLQKQIWRMIRQQKAEMRELIEINHIDEKTWVEYLRELFKSKHTHQNSLQNYITVNDNVTITFEKVEKTLSQLKNRKSPGQDKIPNELLKYGGKKLTQELFKMIQKILEQHTIPECWKTSTMILMLKKGEPTNPNNYRGINLLDTGLKITTKIIANLINSHTTLAEEQQGFRCGRSCNDAIFIIRQIAEKSIEYNKPAFMCFIDLRKAFDRILLKDVIEVLYNRGIPTNIIKTITNIYENNRIQAKIKNKLTTPITVESGIRQGDSLSPVLFNIVMEEIIKRVNTGKGYEMGQQEIKIVCYADDAVLLANNEDDLQRLLHLFNVTAKKYNMTISTEKTKCLVTSKNPVRCKLEVDGNIIEQVMTFRYLGVNVSGYGDIENEVRQQVNKANRVAGCLNDTIWRNKHIGVETKTRIYKATIRPIMTYAGETRPETSKTRRLMETAEMKVLRRILGKTLLDQERSETIRRNCQTENVADWVSNRKKEWNNHINRMDNNRIVRIARDNSPIGRRSVGRPKRRWKDNLNPDG